MDAEFTGREESVKGTLGVAAAVETGAAAVGEGFIGFDAEGKVELDELCWDGFNGWKETVAVRLESLLARGKLGLS